MKISSCFLTGVLLLLPSSLSLQKPPSFTIWNVGQGQWLTYSDEFKCLHFDMGGEFWDSKAVTDLCRGKRNLLFLTHLDWDHISFIPQFRRFFPQICLDPRSQFHESTKKPFFWKTLALCEDSDPDVELIQLTEADFQNRVQPRKPHISSNDLSLIWTLKTILIPGDSSKKAEKKWISRLKNKDHIHVLILGHHGSSTSTSSDLLQSLPFLQWTVVSARKRKYGHPHPDTEYRVRFRGAPLLRTEDWGHVILQL